MTYALFLGVYFDGHFVRSESLRHEHAASEPSLHPHFAPDLEQVRNRAAVDDRNARVARDVPERKRRPCSE